MVYLSANLRTSNEDSPSYIYKYPDDFGGFSPRQALDLCIDGKELRLLRRQSVHSTNRYNNTTRSYCLIEALFAAGLLNLPTYQNFLQMKREQEKEESPAKAS